MRKTYAALAGAMMLLVAAACTDRSVLTDAGPRGIAPGRGSHDDVVNGAVFTSTNPSDDVQPDPVIDDHNLCTNAKDSDAPANNCNIYRDKRFVWLTGGPTQSALSDGVYVFAVLVPGGQGSHENPNDCEPKNLSDIDPCPTTASGAGDVWTHRVFSISGGVITYPADGYPGGHDYDQTRHMIRVYGYDDTENSGGEYDLAVCSLATATNASLDPLADELTNPPGVAPGDCKYDNFKVIPRTPVCPNPEAGDCVFHTPATLSIAKTISTKWNRTFTWGITKAVDKTSVSQIGGTATFNYTIDVTHDAGTDDIGYSGTVTVTNNTTETAHNVVVTDANAPSLTCGAFVSGSDLAPGGVINCTYSETPASTAQITNTATVAWTSVDVNGNPTAPTASDQKVGTFVETDINGCVDVKDPHSPNPPLPATVCSGDASPTEFKYARNITVNADECDPYDNTATIYKTGTTIVLGSASKTVTVCGGVAGGLTMGFWQNKNGQGIITGGLSTAGVCNSTTWLRQYLPFQDLAALSTCAQVGTYVTNIIKAANASGAAMNAMLKAQMLATALDVYFSDPALGTNKIGAPKPIGGINVDLTKICKMIDGSGGTATCSAFYYSTSAAFGGATALTVSGILSYAASQSNAGGSVWYAQVKATQELAKNTFDAINNGVALTAP